MAKRRRMAAVLLTAVFSIVMLLSISYITGETYHDCIGDRCPICEQLQACEHTLNQLTYVAVTVCTAFTLAWMLYWTFPFYSNEDRPRTLITLKVELRN